MKKIKNFWIKNCDDCTYWQAEERIDYKEFCASHRDKEGQPPKIIKKIKEERKDLLKWRIILWTVFCLLSFCLLYYGFNLPRFYANYKATKSFENGHLFYSGVGIVAKVLVYLPILGWSIYQNEKDARKELKELSQKKREWIIEYEI